MAIEQYPYIWRWGTCNGQYPELGKRKGERCKVEIRGGLNSCVVTFPDGKSFVASRNGVRRARG